VLKNLCNSHEPIRFEISLYGLDFGGECFAFAHFVLFYSVCAIDGKVVDAFCWNFFIAVIVERPG
jgi:hypothetical protein